MRIWDDRDSNADWGLAVLLTVLVTKSGTEGILAMLLRVGVIEVLSDKPRYSAQ
jgi:hypothetical protein